MRASGYNMCIMYVCEYNRLVVDCGLCEETIYYKIYMIVLNMYFPF